MSESDQSDEKKQGVASLNRTAIEYLQGKYGHDVQVSSTAAALKSIIDSIERDSLAAAIKAADDGYCRQSFDRTSPGYSKLYDKCSDQIVVEEGEE
jgi:hypothetical protein